MKDVLLSGFLKVALSIQEIPYSGLRVKDSTLIATDGYSLVAFRASSFTVRGEGTLHPITMRALLVYADLLDVYDGLQVDGNQATLKIKLDKYNTQSFSLPALFCPIKAIERVFEKFDRAQFVATNVLVKHLLPTTAEEFVKIDHTGRLVPATADDDYRYSVKQIKKCAMMFRARDEVMLRRSQEGMLSVENDWGQLFVVTPFRRPNQ